MNRFLLIFMAIPCLCFGQSVTSVSGEISHGESITIGGSSFGTKPTAAPMKFETYESGTAGDLLGSEGYWTSYSDNVAGETPEYSSENQRTGNSPTNAKFWLNRGASTYQHDYTIKSGLDFSGGKVLLSYWVWFAFDGNTETQQIKLARIGAGTSDNYVYPHFVTEHWINSSGCYSDARSCSGAGHTNWGYNCPPEGQWSQVTIEATLGDQDGSNGSYDIWQDGQHTGSVTGIDWTQAGCNDFRQIWIGGYLGNGASTLSTEIYYDDVYFDNSFARVELGNNSTYANCTHREIQPITSWSSTSIGVDLNTGSFSTDDTAYLFVVDSDGTASTGHPVIIGGETTPGVTPPAVTGFAATGGN